MVEPARALAEQRARRGIHALDLAAKRREVEPRFEYLRFAPDALERRRLSHLPPLVDDIALSAGFEFGVQIRCELHGQRAAAAPLAGSGLLERRGHREPVDAAMIKETPVFGRQHCRGQRRRYLVHIHPIAAAPRPVETHARQRLAVAVEQPRIRRPPPGAHRREVSDRVRRDQQRNGERRRAGAEHAEQRNDAGALHGFTATDAFGVAPNISGAYIASTRVAGRSNRPGLFSRTVYSSLKRPLGTNS